MSAILQQTLAAILERKDLTRDEARQAMESILSGECTPAQIAGFAVALRMKGERPAEIAGMAEAMRARVPPILTTRRQLLDTCGTGGDNSGTFNIATTVAIVAASCGVAIAKHGNRAMSSRAGSADVLEQLGVSIELTPEDAARAIDEVGLAFLFAPNYHVSLRHASGPRREPGVRTVFNLLGPLTNPAGARRQLLGVYMDPLVRLVAEVLRNLGSERAWIVHSKDGLDEISIFAPRMWPSCATASSRNRDRSSTPGAGAREPRAHRGRLGGGERARIRAVLGGEPSARDIVVLNAAAALVVAETAASLEGVGWRSARLTRGPRPASWVNCGLRP